MTKPKPLKIDRVFKDHAEHLEVAIEKDVHGYYIEFKAGDISGRSGDRLQKWLARALAWIKKQNA